MWSLLIFHWGEHCSTLSQLAPSWPSVLTPMVHFSSKVKQFLYAVEFSLILSLVTIADVVRVLQNWYDTNGGLCSTCNHTHRIIWLKCWNAKISPFLKFLILCLMSRKFKHVNNGFFLMLFLFLLATKLYKLPKCQNMDRPNVQLIPLSPTSYTSSPISF